MSMLYLGFCEKQNKKYAVNLHGISVSALEDYSKQFANGRLECPYASLTGCCTRPDQCSVLKNPDK